MEERLAMFYSQHAPEKMSNVPKLVLRFNERSRVLGKAGAEQEMNDQLRAVYNADLGKRYTAEQDGAVMTEESAEEARAAVRLHAMLETQTQDDEGIAGKSDCNRRIWRSSRT